MHRWLIVLVTVVVAGLVAAPRASAGNAPGHLGDTLRVDTGKIIADITVTSVQPVDTPPAFGYQRADVFPKGFPGSTIDRADVAIHAIKVPTPFQMATDFAFDGVTPFGDAYKPHASDAPTRWTVCW